MPGSPSMFSFPLPIVVIRTMYRPFAEKFNHFTAVMLHVILNFSLVGATAYWAHQTQVFLAIIVIRTTSLLIGQN